jgi:HEAT repeat protein
MVKISATGVALVAEPWRLRPAIISGGRSPWPRRATLAALAVGWISLAAAGLAGEAGPTVTCRNGSLDEAFFLLATRGVNVLILGGWNCWDPDVPDGKAPRPGSVYQSPQPSGRVVPAALRFKPVAARTLVEEAAKLHGFKIAWYRDGKVAILYRGTSDDELRRVEEELASPDDKTRRIAVWRAPYVDDPRIIEPLVKAAAKRELGMIRIFAGGLTRLGWTAVVAAGPPEALDLYVQCCDNFESYRMNIGDFAALTQAGGERGIGILAERRNLRSGWHLHPALTLYLACSDQPRARQMLEEIAAGGNSPRRIAALAALGYIGDKQAVAVLEGALKDAPPEIRAAAVWALGRTGNPEPRAALRKLLASEDEIVRREAILGLARGAEEEDVARLLAAARTWKGKIGHRALFALGETGLDSAADGLAELFKKHEDWNVSHAAASALGEMGTARAVALLKPGVEIAEGGRRLAAIRALGRCAHPEARRILEGLAASGPLADVAVGSLICYGPSAAPVVERHLFNPGYGLWAGNFEAFLGFNHARRAAIIEEMLGHADRAVRGQAAGRLSWGGLGILKAVDKALGSDDAVIREITVRELEMLGGEPARERLAALAKDKDKKLRKQAAESLKRVEEDMFGRKPVEDRPLVVKVPEPTPPGTKLEPGQVPVTPRVVALIRQLNSQEPLEQETAIKKLGQLGKEAGPAAEGLGQMAESGRDYLARPALEALSTIGPPARAAAPALVRLLADEKRANHAALALCRVDPEAARKIAPELIKLYPDDEWDDFVPEVVVETVGPAAAALIPELEKGADSDDWTRRDRALRMLGRIGAPAVPALVRLLAHRNDLVRSDAAVALGVVRPAAKDAVPALLKELGDKSEHVRIKTVEALTAIAGQDEPVQATLERCLLDLKDPYVGQVAARCLAGLKPPEAARKRIVGGLLETMTTCHQGMRGRVAVMLALLSEGQAEVEPALIKLLDSREWVYNREEAAKALGILRPVSDRSVQALGVALKDPHEDVRRSAARSLALCREKCAPVADALKAAMTDRDLPTRAYAAEAYWYATNDGPVTLKALAQTIQESKSDESLPAVEALVRMGPKVPGVVAALGRTVDIRHPLMNAAAIKALREMGAAAKEAIPTLEIAAKDLTNSDAKEVLAAIKAAVEEANPPPPAETEVF